MFLAFVITIILIFLGMYLILRYFHYKADIESMDKYLSTKNITIKKLDDKKILFKGENTKAGMIFYPGGNVEHTAYFPLLAACASKGIMSILCKMPLDLAVLKINAAKGIKKQFPEIENWYMAGHSFGGAMAAIYAYFNANEFKGLILMASKSSL